MNVILYALTTEKAVGLIERNNSIVFVIDSKATKNAVKQEVEKKFNAKVKAVNTLVGHDGRKRAIVKFVKAGDAADIASRLKII